MCKVSKCFSVYSNFSYADLDSDAVSMNIQRGVLRFPLLKNDVIVT